MNWRNNICYILFIFLFFWGVVSFVCGVYFFLWNINYFIEWGVLNFLSLNIVMTLYFDWMSLIFMGVVLYISSMVIFYSAGYMEHEVYLSRFILLVLLFVMSMMLLVISPNMISILLGWDGLGLISYLLVIYYQNFKSFSAGMLTVLSNRLGDVAFLMSIAWMLNYGSWNYIFYVDLCDSSLEATVISLLMIFAAMTKSAQIPFSSWLPAAMAAPTPVSALVHSSTLVTAGVFLMIRFNFLIMHTTMNKYLLLIGGMTMFMSGLGANFEFDLKKIIALSTLSQLGLMMSILSMGYPELAFFHLLTHALFKSLLFMCAGVIIHNMGDCQDIRFMGGLVHCLPLTSSCFMVSNLALCGMPFLSGFYSKDLILEMCLMNNLNFISFIFYFFSTGLTACYTARLIYYSMAGTFSGIGGHSFSDESWSMLSGMLGMLVVAVVGGSTIGWMTITPPFSVYLPFELKTLALSVSLLGASLGYFFSFFFYFDNLISFSFIYFSFFFGSMWFMPYISTYGLIKYPLFFGSYVTKSFDMGWCEYFGGQGLYHSLMKGSILNQFLQNNYLKSYLLFFILLLVPILLFF